MQTKSLRECYNCLSDDEYTLMSSCPDEWFKFLKLHNKRFMEAQCGNWWESLDDKGSPVPFPFRLKYEDIKDKFSTFAQLFVSYNFFDSVGDAKKRGWGKQICRGEFWINKKTSSRFIIE